MFNVTWGSYQIGGPDPSYQIGLSFMVRTLVHCPYEGVRQASHIHPNCPSVSVVDITDCATQYRKCNHNHNFNRNNFFFFPKNAGLMFFDLLLEVIRYLLTNVFLFFRTEVFSRFETEQSFFPPYNVAYIYRKSSVSHSELLYFAQNH
jgi:hypothetical protein